MQEKFKFLLTMPFVWLFIAWMVILLPIILIGSPGFYNDDFAAYKNLSDNGGLFNSIQSWVESFGIGYRPISSFFYYAYYFLLPKNSFLLYIIYQFVYLFVSLALYRQIYFITNDIRAAIFIAIFFLFFPFNAVAYWQIPSLSMVVAIFFSIIVIKNIVTLSDLSSKFKFFVYLIGWILVLLTYEQIFGLAFIIVLLMLFSNFENTIYNTIIKNVIPLAAILIATLLCGLLYVYSEGNPKINSIQSINKIDETVRSSAIDFEEAKTTDLKIYKDVKNSINNKFSNRIIFFTKRVISGIDYLKFNTLYSLKKLLSLGFIGYIMSIILILPGLFIFFMPASFLIAKKIKPIYYINTGALWCFVSLAPFFLYEEVHIPPYTLMLPSIGLGILFFGVFQYIQSIFPKTLFNLVGKFVLISIVVIFPLNQYGYYFGLKEEIRYWDSMLVVISNVKIDDIKNPVKLDFIPRKDNLHISWLENAVGSRYFADITGQVIDLRRLKYIDNELILFPKDN